MTTAKVWLGVQAVRDGEREVRELIAGRERDERAISLATPYYDVVRQKHGESDEETEEASEVAVDYLTQFLPLVTGTRSLNRQEALEVRERSLKVQHKSRKQLIYYLDYDVDEACAVLPCMLQCDHDFPKTSGRVQYYC